MPGQPPALVSCAANCQLTITTTFTPPTTCFDNWTPVATSSNLASPEAPFITFTQNSTKAECVPSGLASCISTCSSSSFLGICPSGWLAASVGHAEGTTTNVCCPSDAGTFTFSTCSGDITSTLKKLVYNTITPTESVEFTVATIAGSAVASEIIHFGSSVEEVTETIFLYTGYFAANPIIATFNGDEFPSSVTFASTTSANSSMLGSSKTSITGLAPSKTSITGPTPSVATSPSGEQGTLSSGAKAGIGVGVALGVCAMVALGFLIYRSRKRKTAGERSTSGGERPKSNNMQMKTAELRNDAMRDHELPASSRQELEEHHGVAEARD